MEIQTELMGYANEIFAIMAVAVVAYLGDLARQAVKAFTEKTKGMLDEDARYRLEVAADKAIKAAENRGQAVTLDEVIGYLKEFNAGDLKRFELEGQKLVNRVKTAIAAGSTVKPASTADEIRARKEA